MMGKSMTEMGEGERAERAKRMRFWKRIGALAAVGGLTGFAAGFLHGRNSAKSGMSFGEAMTTVPPWMVIFFALFMVVGLVVITWVFVKSVDEVEIADNLWASSAGLYAYSALFPLWWLLAQAKVVGEPNDWIIFAVTFASAMAVYGWRKWIAR